MQIVCPHCQRQLNLPDERVPAHRFALDCPACQGRFEVDPSAAPPGDPAAAAPTPPAPAPAEPESANPPAPEPDAPTPQPWAQADDVEFEPLPTLREGDQELLATLYPLAAIVRPAGASAEPLVAGLRLLGMEEIELFDDVASAAERMLESDFSILLVALERATAPPCELLRPLYDLPLSVRRDTFTALMAGNVRSLDGQTAFYLEVNCLLSSQELARFPAYLQRALLFHRRHYRYWGVRDDG